MSARLADPKPIGARGTMNPERAAKIAAKRIGVSVGEYVARRAGGEKWCSGCKAWHSREAFAADLSRADGLKNRCRAADSAYIKNYLRYYNCSGCGTPSTGKMCADCYAAARGERRLHDEWIKHALKLHRGERREARAAADRTRRMQRDLQRRVDRDTQRGEVSILCSTFSLDAAAPALDGGGDFHDTGGTRLRVAALDDPIETVQRERLWEIVGDADPAMLGERELERLRERLRAEGFSPPPVTQAERERLGSPDPHSGARVKAGGGHGGRRGRAAQGEVTRQHHVRNMTKAQKHAHAQRRRAARSRSGAAEARPGAARVRHGDTDA